MNFIIKLTESESLDSYLPIRFPIKSKKAQTYCNYSRVGVLQIMFSEVLYTHQLNINSIYYSYVQTGRKKKKKKKKYPNRFLEVWTGHQNI